MPHMSSSADTAEIQRIRDWIPSHLNQLKLSDKTINIFAVAGPPTFGPDKHGKRYWDFEINIPIDPVILVLEGSVDLETNEIDGAFHVKFPLISGVKMAQISGNLIHGVGASVNATDDPIRVRGSVEFYLQGDDLCMKPNLSIMNRSYEGHWPLITLP